MRLGIQIRSKRPRIRVSFSKVLRPLYYELTNKKAYLIPFATRLWFLVRSFYWGSFVTPFLNKFIKLGIIPLMSGYLLGSYTFTRRLALYKSKAQKKKSMKKPKVRRVKRGRRNKKKKKQTPTASRYFKRNMNKAALGKEALLRQHIL